jgi:TusA-related sulfurtransferase
MSEFSFDQELDCRGLLCPLPIVKTKQVMDTMSPGQVLKMQSTDKGSVIDVQAWTRQTGNELINSHETDGIFTYYVRKQQ